MHDLSPRVLVVDDDDDVRAVIDRYLSNNDFAVQHASSGEEALEKLARETFEVVLLDQVMPGMYGTDVLTNALGLGIDASFIMITGLGDGETVRKALRLGVFDFVDKPMDLKVLLQTVYRAAEVCRRQRSANLRGVGDDGQADELKAERDNRVARLLRALNSRQRSTG